MSEKLIKIENIKGTEFTVNVPTSNGYIKPYVWKPARLKRRSILDIPEEVYEYIKYNSCTFRDGWLVIAKEETDEVVIEEVAADTEDLKVYTIEDITKLLNGDVKKLKSELANVDKQVALEFARVAKEIKLDSASKKKVIAEKLGHKNNVDFVLGEEE